MKTMSFELGQLWFFHEFAPKLDKENLRKLVDTMGNLMDATDDDTAGGSSLLLCGAVDEGDMLFWLNWTNDQLVKHQLVTDITVIMSCLKPTKKIVGLLQLPISCTPRYCFGESPNQFLKANI